MHDVLFGAPKHLDEDSLMRNASSLNLDSAKLTACLDGPAAASIRHDHSEGESLGVTGTPAFFIGRVQSDGLLHATTRISGVRSISDFKSALDNTLLQK
jgi:protein-disulfide isomerase